MHTALRCNDVIYEAENIFVIGIIVLQGYFHIDIILGSLAVDDLIIDRCLAPVQVGHEFLDTTLIVEGIFAALLLRSPEILQRDLQILGQESRLSQTNTQGIIIIDQLIEDHGIRLKGDLGSRTFGLTHHLKIIHNSSSFIPLLIDLAVTTDFNLQPFGQSIYNGGTYAVQTAGNLISSTAEFTACVKDRKYHLNCGTSGLLLNVNGDTTSVIHNRYGIILIDVNLDLTAVTGKGFINRIVHDLIDQMV